MQEWKLTQGTQEVRPEAVDTTSSSEYVYVRKEIEQITVTSENGDVVTMWQYYEKEMTNAEYQVYLQINDAVTEAQEAATQTVMQSITELQLQLDLLG